MTSLLELMAVVRMVEEEVNGDSAWGVTILVCYLNFTTNIILQRLSSSCDHSPVVDSVPISRSSSFSGLPELLEAPKSLSNIGNPAAFSSSVTLSALSQPATAAAAAPASGSEVLPLLSQRFKCTQCDFRCTSVDECSIHAGETDHFDCFEEESAVDLHGSQNDDAVSEDDLRFKCTICDFRCASDTECSIHAAETDHFDCFVEDADSKKESAAASESDRDARESVSVAASSSPSVSATHVPSATPSSFDLVSNVQTSQTSSFSLFQSSKLPRMSLFVEWIAPNSQVLAPFHV
jgi:hypothetical protein